MSASALGVECLHPIRTDLEIRAQTSAIESVSRTLKNLGTNTEARRAFVANLRADMKRKSARTLNRLRAANQAGAPEIVDVAVVGGGPHAAIFNSNLSAVNPELRVLTIEARDEFRGTLGSFGKFFNVTSPQGPGLGANLFPGSPIQIADWTNDRYPMAELFGDVAATAQHYSSSETLLGTQVREVEDLGTHFRVQLGDGTSVNARAVVDATGLGRPRVPFKDPESLRILAEEQATGKIQVFDESAARALRDHEAGKDPRDFYKDEDTMIIGAGQAANYVMEFFLGRSNPEIFRKATKGLSPRSVEWLGQPARNADEFRKQNPERFHATLGDLFEIEGIKNVPGMVQSLRREGDKFRVFFKAPDGTESSRLVSRIVIAAGNEKTSKGLLAPQLRGSSRVVAEPGLASQIVAADGTLRDIYSIGTAADGIVKPEQISGTLTKNPVTIEALGGRTAEFARWLNADVTNPAQTGRAARATNILDTRLPGKTTVFFEGDSPKSGMIKRSHQGKTLGRLNFQSKPGHVLKIAKSAESSAGTDALLISELVKRSPDARRIEITVGRDDARLFAIARQSLPEEEALRAIPAFQALRGLGFEVGNLPRLQVSGDSISWQMERKLRSAL